MAQGKRWIGWTVLVLMAAWGCRTAAPEGGTMKSRSSRTWTDREAREIARRMKKYTVVPMDFDARTLAPRQRELLRRLVEAARLADEIFWRQTAPGNVELRERILKTRSPDDPVRRFFLMQGGPYDRLDHNAPFMDVPPKPPGAGFYPPDMTREEFEQWLRDHPEDKEAFLSPYTVIRRRDHGLTAIPYHVEYRDLVEPLARKLEEAAALAGHEGLRRYLRLKARAVRTDDYYEADLAWIDLTDAPFDLALGPFEVYEDELNNIKAAYEATVEIVDREASRRLDRYKKSLDQLEAYLPYPEAYKEKSAGLTAAFVIVRDVYRGGQIRSGYQPVAANLPNDPRVHMTKGTKKTFWKNVLEARVNHIIVPIARRLIAPEQLDGMTPEGLFDFILLHEIAHGLGPRYVHGSRTPVNVALRDLYSWIEENKADLAGLHSLRYLRDHGVIDPAMRRQHLISYLGSIFRTIRFGTGEAHGKAALVSLNYFLRHGGVRYDADRGRFAVEFDRLEDSIASLARELLMIEATGDYARAEKLEADYGKMPEVVEGALARLEDLPVDVVPEYHIRW